MEPKPIREIVRVTEDGHPMVKPCQHALDQADCVLPGLDADYCTLCRVYWVDQSIQNEVADRLDEIEGIFHELPNRSKLRGIIMRSPLVRGSLTLEPDQAKSQLRYYFLHK